MTTASYQQFCPVAMAAEVLCTRWTVVLLREMFAGSTRFNELRRGVPRMSPALLSQPAEGARSGRHRCPRGLECRCRGVRISIDGIRARTRPAGGGFGIWGQRRIESKLSLQHLDVDLLMWDMRRNLNTTPMPARRSVVEIVYPKLPAAQRRWWLIVDPARGVDLCKVDPGFDVDLYVSADLRSMTAIWLGLDTVRAAVANQQDRADRKPAARCLHADLAWPQSVCEGTEARELAIRRRPRRQRKSCRSTVRELDRDGRTPITAVTDDAARENIMSYSEAVFAAQSKSRSRARRRRWAIATAIPAVPGRASPVNAFSLWKAEAVKITTGSRTCRDVPRRRPSASAKYCSSAAAT